MKKSQPYKRTLVIVERLKLPLDFCFDTSDDGQKIKKMRILDTNTDTNTLIHVISTKDTLDKANLTTNHRKSQADLSSKKYLTCRVKEEEEEVDIDGLDEIDTASSDIEVDIEGVYCEEDQQIEATSEVNKDNFVQSVALLQVASNHQGENDKVKEPTTPDLSKTKPTTTTEQPKPVSNPNQEANTTKPVVEAQSAPKRKAISMVNRLVFTHQCHLCAAPTNYLQLGLHYASVHNITIPRSAKYLHLLPDPNNADYYCQMCDKKSKTQVAFVKHLRNLHKIRCSYATLAPTPDFKSATVSSKSLSATSSLTPPSSDQSSASPSAPSTVQNNTNSVTTKNKKSNKATPVSNIENNNFPTSSKAQIKTTMPASTIQNGTSDFSVKFFLKDGLMNRIVTSPLPRTSRLPKQNTPPANAPSPAMAPQPTTQRILVAAFPNLLDPYNHCRCCNKTLSNSKIYRQHCRAQHTIPLPDPNDPNFFCYVCSLKSPDLFTYRKHMDKLHQMKGFPEMFDIKCYHCRRTFADGKKYNAHLKKVAKREQEIQLMEKRPPPMWDEPNFHCSKCLRTFEGDKGYKAHLRTVHRMTATKYFKSLRDAQEKSNHSNEVMNRGDADKDHFFCFACRKDFFDKHEFDQHLKMAHKLNITKASIDNLKIAPSPPVFAKPLDPTLYYFMMKDIGEVGSY